MPIEHIVTALSVRLANIAGNPQQVIYAITTQDMLLQIVRRMGAKALRLSAKDIMLARREVRAAFEHFSDHRDCINAGLDAWELSRKTSQLVLQDEIPSGFRHHIAAV